MRIFFFIILINLILIKSTLVIPIKENDTAYNEELDKNLYFYFTKRLYINISIGTPPQIIPTYLNFEKPGFYFSTEENKMYNKLDSSSFRQVSPNQTYNDEYFDYGNFSSETMRFKNDKNKEITINDFNFILASNHRKLSSFKPGEIGLKMIKTNSAFPSNFIFQLKQRNIIEKIVFSYIFYNKFEGDFLVGKYPHEYNNKVYKEENLRLLSADVTHEVQIWCTNFDNVYFGNTLIKDDIKTIYFKSEFSGITVSDKFFKNCSQIFFNQYFNNKKCTINKKHSSYNFVICDNDIDISKFPSLKFEHRIWNYTFELNYNDLFIKFGNKYYCLFAFYSFNTDVWYLGEVFLRKYTIVFDQDNKVMGFYHPYIEKGNQYILTVFISIILILCILLLIFLYYKFLNKKQRRIRNNEIDDNYEYLIK